MEIRSILSKNIKRLRKELGYSQEALADVCGMHRTYISGIERGERNPTVTVLAKVAKGLKVPPSALLEK